MIRPLVIFGAGDMAELAHFYFTREARYQIAAFCVDAAYLKEEHFCGAPVVPFEEINKTHPPGRNDFFVALSYARLNAVRKEKYLAVKGKGYKLTSYLSDRATLLNNGRVGDNCFVLEDSTVQPFVTIGNNVTLWSGSHVGHHSSIGDHCFVAPHVAISGGVVLGEQCFLGVNATIRNHIKVGDRCVIGAGALLLSDAAPEGVYVQTATHRSEVPSSQFRRP